jgi:hypothetical protein
MIVYSNLELNGNPIIDSGWEILASLPASGESVGHTVAVGSSAPYDIFVWNGDEWIKVEAIVPMNGIAPIVVSGEDISIDAATGSSAGSMSAADKAKLDAAANTPTANVLAMYDAGGRLETASPVDPTDVANKAYVDEQIAELGQYVGGWDASAGLPTTGSGQSGDIEAGDMWTATVEGTIVGLSPVDVVSVGDVLVATVDGAAGAAQFVVIQRNLEDPGIIEDVVKEYRESATFSNNTWTTITHNLANEYPVVEVFRNSDGRKVNPRVASLDENSIRIRFNGIGLPAAFTIVVHAAVYTAP